MSDKEIMQQWPADQLEWLGACPVCASHERTVLLDGLRDDVFRCAPGAWTLHRCHGCNNAYLDPRPDRASIGNAYATYYTHEQPAVRDDYASLSWLRRLRRRAANAYSNRRYGTNLQPASTHLGWLLALVRALRYPIDITYRWLPKPASGARLLDVGCGNGAFLNHAAVAGWRAYGADPDPNAIREVLAAGHQARLGGIEAYADMAGQFDAITFSHSIEHVHDPVANLRMAHDLLKPGGVLYVDTPDVDSPGRRSFGPAWRGIEAPRHLVLFSGDSLCRLLGQCGFILPVMHPRYAVVSGMSAASMLLKSGESAYGKPSMMVKWRAMIHSALARLMRRPEFITLTCVRGR